MQLKLGFRIINNCRSIASKCSKLSRGFAAVAAAAPKAAHDDHRLRILFCGTDHFSVASLVALHGFYKSPASHIDSIDVVTKPDKRTGRGLRKITLSPVKSTALELGLRVHELDTFTGWSLPSYPHHTNPYINLVIAVSFGKLVPARILHSCQYGGINVHPSMLPLYKGPAPIQWQIIDGEVQTGISLQTLHPREFDEGVILDQTPQPGFSIPNPDSCDYNEFRDFVAPLGADMLVRAIESRLYVPPYHPVQGPIEESVLAPKITAKMKTADFTEPAEKVLRKVRAVGQLRSVVVVKEHDTRTVNEVLFYKTMHMTDDKSDLPPAIEAETAVIEPGLPYAVVDEHEDLRNSVAPLKVNTKSGTITIPDMTIAGSANAPALAAAARGHLIRRLFSSDGQTIWIFHKRLRRPDSDVEIRPLKSGDGVVRGPLTSI